MSKAAIIVGIISALWIGGRQGIVIAGLTIPYLSTLQLMLVAFALWVVTGGHYWLWIAYKTLPRDLKAGARFFKVRSKLLIAQLRDLSVPKLFMENVRKNPNKVALIFEGREWTFAQIDEYSNRVGNFLVEQGLKHGDCVSLFMRNRPEYVCIWLGCAKVGVIPALINFNLRHVSLTHSIKVADSKAVICGVELQDAIAEVQNDLDIQIYVSGSGNNAPNLKGAKNLDPLLSASNPTPPPQLDTVKYNDKLIYIYTSGTTGLPKAAIIKHAKFMFFVFGVHHMLGLTEDEIIYNPLPLYHSAGGMIGMGQVLLFNNTAVIREKFSASKFWVEAKKYNCTVGQYVGELCRYLLNTPSVPEETQHKVKVMFGNGVRAQNWEHFTSRFKMPFIAEFYGATEGIANIVNMEGKPGCCGFLPVILPHVMPCYLIKVDEETGEPLRDAKGMCIRCKPGSGESGEFVGVISRRDPVRDFQGYADKKATDKKIVRDVIRKGDMAFRSGDILIQDEFGYLYFLDRTGDTFRWRGENVSSTEVEGVVSLAADNKDAVVYGVEVPGAEGRAGMAAIVDPENKMNMEEVVKGIKKHLPVYARPLFVRVIKEIDVTGTFKLKKLALQKEGFNPNVIKDKMYYLNNKLGKYVDLSPELYSKIEGGEMGL
ncbi:hypothetical protein SK128_013204 [Halocaridina rubra]|uniref:Very long-chain fatty acid transport protein n=1 Tax=Halocaridina rubra TaxID=373956 RepID=A0AAN8XGK0_HALRR